MRIAIYGKMGCAISNGFQELADANAEPARPRSKQLVEKKDSGPHLNNNIIVNMASF
jgi:hypothetical protein